jgi:hypothetical protein
MTGSWSGLVALAGVLRAASEFCTLLLFVLVPIHARIVLKKYLYGKKKLCYILNVYR